MIVFQNACQWMSQDITGKNKIPQCFSTSVYKNTETYSLIPLTSHSPVMEKVMCWFMNMFPLKDFAAVKQLTEFRDVFQTLSEGK